MPCIETPRGPVEYLVEGSGPAVLYFHGTPCSSRMAAVMEGQLIADGFQLIIPQRPGYYGTTLGKRRMTTDCAEAAASVLDHLNVHRVAVIGTSGGGPPALAFAARYPQLTAALILQCAQSHRWDNRRWAPASHPWLYDCFRTASGRWAFSRFFPTLFQFGLPTTDHYLRSLTGARFSTMHNDPGARNFADSVRSGMAEFPLMRRGYQNDLTTWYREDVLADHDVTCPTLLLYDPADPQAPFCHAQYAAEKISVAQLVELKAGGHLIWWGPDADRMQQTRTMFLREHLGAA
jgi:pimeloyl-ACP methyl ester carboxylesterase